MLQFSLDPSMESQTDFENLAILQIIYPDQSSLGSARKIIEGIVLPEPSHTPLKLLFNTEPISSVFTL